MVFGKISDAVSDLTETLRRVFRDPPAHEYNPALAQPRSHAISPLVATPITPAYSPQAVPATITLPFRTLSVILPIRFEGHLKAEDGWTSWATDAVICQMPVFGKTGGRQIGIPPLPRRASCLRQEMATFRTSTRSIREPFLPPSVRGGSPNLGTAVVLKALELALGLPVAFPGRDFQTLPKPLQMRYTLQIVKATGENIRNLDLLGLYRIPSKGVSGMRHDPKSGNLFLELTPEVAESTYLPFVLARRKDDRSLVSCFLEGG